MKIGIAIAQYLTAGLQNRGIEPHNYQKISTAVYGVLCDMPKILTDDWIELPDGTTYEKTFSPSKKLCS